MNKKALGFIFAFCIGISATAGALVPTAFSRQNNAFQEVSNPPAVPDDDIHNFDEDISKDQPSDLENNTGSTNLKPVVNHQGMHSANFTRFCKISKQSNGIRVQPTIDLNKTNIKFGTHLKLKVLLQTANISEVKLNNRTLQKDKDYTLTARNGIWNVDVDYHQTTFSQDIENFCFIDIVCSANANAEVQEFWIYALDEMYLPLKYIQSSGSEYIDTGYKPNENTRIEFQFMATDNPKGWAWTQITGAREFYRHQSAWQVAYNVDLNRIQVELGTSVAGAVDVSRNTIIDMAVDKNGTTVDGQHFDKAGTLSGICKYTLWIFDDNNAGNKENPFTGRIYGYKIYDNGKLVRNYVPMFRKIDDAIGLYDLVNNQFYGNRGSGNFTCEYTFDSTKYHYVNYIESSGNEIIDTGYKPNENTELQLSFSCSSNPKNTGWTQVTGSREFWQSPTAWQVAYNVDLDLVQAEIGTSGAGQISTKKESIVDAVLNKNGSLLNGKFTSKVGTLAATSNYNLWIFDDNSAGNKENPFTGKIYSYKIYENNTLVRYFLPAVRKADGQVGLVDVLSNTFYGNTAAGAFKTEQVFDSANYTELGYIKGTGTQYIDLGWVTTAGMVCEYTASWQEGGWLIGSHDPFNPNAANGGYGRNGAYLDSSAGWVLGFGDFCPVDSNYERTLNKKFDVKFSTLPGAAYLDVNGTRLLNIGYGTEQTTATSSVMIFTNYHGISENAAKSKATIYSAKIWDKNGGLIFDLVPAIRKADGAVGMLNMVTNTFYGNSGTGVFATD